MAKLESLIVDMQLETAELRKGLDEIKHQLKEAGEHAEGLLNFEVLKEVGELAFEAGEKLADFALEGAETADKMGKLASSVGISIETFSRLNYAASLSKLSTDEFGVALGKLNVKIAGAASGNKDAAALFHVLGVAVKDAAGNTRSADQVIGDLASTFSKVKDGASKGLLAVDLFGKSGKQLIPFLNEGKEGIARLSDEADRFGITISGKTVAAATEFNDNLERMKKTIEGVGVQLAAQLAPAMVAFTDQLLKSKAGAEGLKDSVTVLATAMKLLVSAGVAVAGAFSYVATALAGGLASAIAAFSGDFTAANEITKDMQHELSEVSTNMGARFKAIWETAGEAPKAAAEATKKSADSMVADLERLKKAAAEMEARFREAKTLAEKLSTAHFAETDQTRNVSKASEQGALAQEQFSNRNLPTQTLIAQVTKGFQDYDDAMEKFTQAQIGIINEQAAMAEAKRQFDVEGYDFASEALANQEEIARKAKDAADQFSEMDRVTRSQLEKMAGFLEQAAANFVSKLGDFGAVASAAAAGFQQGGIWGALIAALVELFTKFSRFGELIAQGNQIIKDLLGSMGSGLSVLTTGLHSLLAGVGSLLNVVGSLLNGPLHGVAIMFDHLGKTLSAVMDGIGPALDALGGILDGVMSMVDILDPMKPIILVLGAIFKVVGIALLELNRGIMAFIGMIAKAISDFFRSVGLNDLALTFSSLFVKLQTGADAAGVKAEDMWNSLGHTFDDMGKDNSLNNRDNPINTPDLGAADTAGNLKDLGKQTEKTTAALAKLTEQFTNLPQGFRVRLRAYQATDAVPFDAATRHDGDVHIHAAGGITTTVDQLVQLIEQAQGRQKYRKKGF